ncbi:hypothetical protein [Polyangium jinanense]|uniref:Lipoprotein n=1 Tax=Polyangium jinanense TaxID=2829994 RepID=A0A9X4ATV2_9BACT|nr:hypothetical protein [Polyangium jinanense]MDC3957595.1 hypothetical protein [Polyangium jinanense]MDC3984623.1 hypothetical protein [Polyangium jinanense]
MRILSLLVATIPLVSLAACGAAQNHAVERGPMAPPPGESALCSPLPNEPASQRVVALPAAEREALEKRLEEGPVAVKLEGCKLVVVKACELRASAAYRAAPEDGSFTLSNEADIEREVPLGKGRLGTVVNGGRALEVKLAQAGRFTFGGATATPEATEACKEATHVVRGYTIGAFEVAESASGAPVEKAGDTEACAKGAANATTPPAGCGALVSIDLVALDLGADDDTRRVEVSRPPSPITGEGKRDEDADGFVGGVDQGAPARGAVDVKEEGKPKPGKHCPPKDPLCAY